MTTPPDRAPAEAGSPAEPGENAAEAARGGIPRRGIPRRGIPRRFLLRFLFLVALVGAGFLALRFTPLAGLLQEGKLVETFRQLGESPWAPVVLIACYAVLSPFGVPATPLMIAGGVIFGVGWGSLYNLIGTFTGGATTYFVARYMGRDFLRHLLGQRLEPVERAVARQGFWGLLRIRFVPLPFPLVNYSAGLAGVPAGPFLASTAVGLLPTSFLFTYFSAALFRAAAGERSGMILQLLLATLGLLALTFVPTLISRWKRRKRQRSVSEG